MNIHQKEDKSQESYKGFLCEDPLISTDEEIKSEIFPGKTGSFHFEH